MSEVAEANPIQDLIQNTIDQNYTTANGNFMDIMTLKLNDVLDQEKIRLADQIYNGIEDVDHNHTHQRVRIFFTSNML